MRRVIVCLMVWAALGVLLHPTLRAAEPATYTGPTFAQIPSPSALHIAAMTITNERTTPAETVKVLGNGRIFWNGREVTTDAQLRAAMLQAMRGMRCTQ